MRIRCQEAQNNYNSRVQRAEALANQALEAVFAATGDARELADQNCKRINEYT